VVNAVSNNDIFIHTIITIRNVTEYDFIKYDSVYNIRLTPPDTQNTIDYVWMLNDQTIPVTYENNSYGLPFVKHKPFHVLKCIYTDSKIKFGSEFDLTFDCMYSKHSNSILEAISNIFSPPKTIEERLEDLENKLDHLLLNLKKIIYKNPMLTIA
jgi:hypothetical protein